MTDQRHEATGRRRAEASGRETSGPEAFGPEAFGPEALGPEAFHTEASRLQGAGHHGVRDTGTRIVHGTGSTSAGAAGARASERKRPPWWLLALLAVVAIAALLLGLTRCGDDRADTATVPAPPSAAAPVPAPNAPAPAGQAPDAGVPTAGAPTAANGQTPNAGPGSLTTADGTSLFPTVAGDGGSLAGLAGTTVTAKAVPVQSVPADEGFWVGTSATDRVWVQLASRGESAIQIKQGQLLDLSGPVVAHGADFAGKVGLSGADGAQQLTREAAHVEANPDRVTIVGTR